MRLTISEFGRFSAAGRLMLLHEYGQPLFIREAPGIKIAVYRLFDFLAEVIYSSSGNLILVAPVSRTMARFYLTHL